MVIERKHPVRRRTIASTEPLERKKIHSGTGALNGLHGYIESPFSERALLRVGQTGDMPEGDLSGGRVIAISPQTLRWATDQMMETLGPETLKKLKVRSGEHLAALLTATFLLTPPTSIDKGRGGADLRFDLSRKPGDGMKPAPILPDGTALAAFEIKSMPGPFREFDGRIDGDRARGVDTISRSLTTQVQAANDVLREAVNSPELRRARDQLHRNTNAETSRNIFLVIHLFDYFVAECMQPILGPLLDPLPDIEGVDTLWVLWPLEHLTVWSNEQREWTDLLFNVGDPEAETSPDEMDALQDAENYFLTRVGHTRGSPYLFRLSADGGSAEDE